jgi:threonine dehydrogenase-like Zn-dependent dehydrogenase
MKAIVFHSVGDIRLEDVAEPEIEAPTDAIVRLTASAICGTDLHFVRGSVSGMKSGTILGHEGVGIVEEAGEDVRNTQPGDRVLIPSTLGCGYCSYCREGYFAQCDNVNPNGALAGTAFFGGPKSSGSFQGMQAEKVRVPFANVNLLKLPDTITDDEAILLSDIVPTGFFGADLADIAPGHTVAVFGCGPVGLFAILSAMHMGAGRVLAIDRVPSRLARARELGAEVIDFEKEDPVATVRRLTGNIGVDRVIDAVGVDAEHAESGPAAPDARKVARFAKEREETAPEAQGGDHWVAGSAPGQVLEWAVECVAKAGTIAIIGVYPPTMQSFPIGKAMNKNLTLHMGNCNHRRYLPHLIELVESGAFEPSKVVSQRISIEDAIEAYEAFDGREEGWIKVELLPSDEATRV